MSKELEVGDRVQLIIPELMAVRSDVKDYIGILQEKTETGWLIAWLDGYEDPVPDYKSYELQKVEN